MSMAFIFSMNVYALGGYRKALKAYFKTNEELFSTSTEQFRQGLLQLNKQILPSLSEYESKRLVKKYIDGGAYIDAIVEVVEPAMKKHLTEAELVQLTEVRKKPGAKTYEQHVAQSTNASILNSSMASIAQNFFAGNAPNDIQPNPACSKEYVEKFNQYYELSGTDTIISKMLDVQKSSISSTLQSEVQGFSEFYDQFMDYLKRNSKTITMNSMCEYLTMEDLDYAVEWLKMPAAQHLREAAPDMIESIIENGTTILMNYGTWLEEQGITIRE